MIGVSKKRPPLAVTACKNDQIQFVTLMFPYHKRFPSTCCLQRAEKLETLINHPKKSASE